MDAQERPHIKRRTPTRYHPSDATVDVHGCTNVAGPWMAKSDHFCALRQYERMESGGVTALLSLLPK